MQQAIRNSNSRARESISTPPAQLDSLTGLPTQTCFNAKLAACLKLCRHQRLVATLALLQLENFYEIRSWVGPAEANLLLRDISQLLQKSLPPSVTLCRCEHYEFAVLLTDSDSRNAELITDRVKTALQSAVSSTIPPQLELKCVVGLARLNRETPTCDVLFARARHSISHAHIAYRDAELRATVEWSEAKPLLCQALKENALQLSFQPMVSLQADQFEHYEVRCKLPKSCSHIPAGLIFEHAAQNAMGEAIDRWVILKVLEILAQKQKASLRLTVNLTINSLVSAQFLQWLAVVFKRNRQPASQLLFQISEIDVLSAQHHLQNFSQELKRLGAGLCITHFGCTADPMRYLPLLRIQTVKLDRSRLENIHHDAQRREELQQLVQDLNAGNIRVIAGMLEDTELLPWLCQAGLDFVQGNCLRPPAPTLDFEIIEEQCLKFQ